MGFLESFFKSNDKFAKQYKEAVESNDKFKAFDIYAEWIQFPGSKEDPRFLLAAALTNLDLNIGMVERFLQMYSSCSKSGYDMLDWYECIAKDAFRHRGLEVLIDEYM